MKKFYTHLIEIEELTVELDQLNLEDHQRLDLAKLADSNIHNVVMDAILSKLPEEEKEKFARLATSEDHEKVWEFLKSRSNDIEDEIRKAAKEMKKKMKEDIEEAKKR